MLRDCINKLESGELTPADLTAMCLERIRERDGEVRAWVVADPQPATGFGLLRGIPFGVKDVIDTARVATGYGSPLFADRVPARDATVVADLRQSGAVMLGKTATAAFAWFDPPPTRNPRAPGRTPGGSSSGSAAAVAAGMVPFALGTQTLGSVVRPASYCGICGFKPSFGLLSTAGILPFAPSLDTVGLFTQSVADMELLWSRGFGGEITATLQKIAAMPLPVEPEMAAAFGTAVERLRREGVIVDELPPPKGFERLHPAALTIAEYEGARSHQRIWRDYGGRIGSQMAELVTRGLAIPDDLYVAARETVAGLSAALGGVFWEYPLLVTPAATGAAPLGFDSTGDPAMNSPWTAIGIPALSIPLPVDGPPLGMQAVAAWGRDDALLAVAVQLEALLGAPGA
jgi:Asp-tRNA(Asn)/Glu-tRNA(Gln) amidotransferase A subunit family amidase